MINRYLLSIVRNILIPFILFGMFASFGCGKPSDNPPASDVIITSTPLLSTVQPVSTPQKDSPLMPSPVAPTLQNLTDLAKEDLAQRLSIPSTSINLIEARAVTWSDASLGCPQEGFAYAQVLTPGYLILLEYADHRYEYHAGQGRNVIYCIHPMPPVPNDPGNT